MLKTSFEHCSEECRAPLTGDAGGRRTELRQRLVDTAERVVAARGLSALRARDLAAEAGCALGTIYTVFDNIDELTLQVGSRTLAMLEEALAAAGGGRCRSAAGAEKALIRLALAYLAFAAAHRARWRALFEHRMADGRPLPGWFIEQQHRLFAQAERPLAVLLPQLADTRRRVLARTLFSAVHGIVALGLEEKLAALPAAELRRQLAAAMRAIVSGRAALA